MDMQQEMAALRAELAEARQSKVAAEERADRLEAAQPAQLAPLPAIGADDEREMSREAKSLLSKVKSSQSMKSLLAALAANVPSTRLTRIQLKKHILKACTDMEEMMDTASQQSGLIQTTDTFKGLVSVHEDLEKLESELLRLSYTTRAEFDRTVRLLSRRPLELELPRQVSDASATSGDDAPTVAATTSDQESDGGMTEEGEDILEPLVDVERVQPPPAADDPAKVREAFDLIMGCTSLRQKLRFDLAPLLRRVHEHIQIGLLNANGGVIDPLETAKMFGGGKTQARKTPLKLCAFVLCRMMGVSTVLVTTNVSGREDLFSKFIELLGDLDVPAPPTADSMTTTNDVQYRYYQVKEQELDHAGRTRESIKFKLTKEPHEPLANETRCPEGVLSITDVKGTNEGMRRWASRQLSRGACVIVNNTAQAIQKASGTIEQARGMCVSSRVRPVQFMLTIDEADDFYRTDSQEDGSQEHEIQMERQMRNLKDLGPLCQFEVTATLLAIYMQLLREGEASGSPTVADIFYVEASEEYVDASMLVPPSDANGNFQFITNPTDLNNNNKYADSKVRTMWKKAADHKPPQGRLRSPSPRCHDCRRRSVQASSFEL